MDLAQQTLVVGGGPRLLRAGRVAVTAKAEGFAPPQAPAFFGTFVAARQPRTLAGVRADGTLLLVTVDGRRPGWSVGMTLPEAARLMRSLGARDALNLDGGGSTTMIVRGEVVNRPSDRGGERRGERRAIRAPVRALLATAAIALAGARTCAGRGQRRRVGRRRRGHARASARTAWPRSCAAADRTASSTWATSTRPARARSSGSWYHPRFGRLARITEPTIGNHEWDNRFEGYYRYWYRRKGERLPPWSKTEIAGWEILNLNSQAPHGTRLASGPLARVGGRREPGDCRIAFWHRPRYSAGAYGGAPGPQPVLEPARRATPGSCSAGTTTTSSATAPSAGSRSTSWAPAAAARYMLHRGQPDAGLGPRRRGRRAPHGAQAGARAARVPRARGRLLDRSRATCSPG